ncbi:MAG: DegT/DnrJ/EryC1/StrS family aminotransferase [Dehalococcoidia bacterium]
MLRKESSIMSPSNAFAELSDARYVLVTPAKDEEDNLPNLIDSVVNQDIKPVAWFIVDDASTDRTQQIVRDASVQYPWIHLVTLTQEHTYDLGEHYSMVCMKGFEAALHCCEDAGQQVDYIALSDTDMIYPKGYFANCIRFLQNNPEFGIVSGTVLVRQDGETAASEERRIPLGNKVPRGTGRVWRWEAFVQTGGYILTRSPDTVSNVMAQLKGWGIRELSDVACFQTRGTSAKNGVWPGYFNRGQRHYYVGMNPLQILNAMIALIIIARPKNCVIKALALFCGYAKSFIRRDERLQDAEVGNYLGSYRRMLRNHGCKEKYYHLMPGFNSRLDSPQAAILRVKLKHLDEWIEQRRQNTEFYSRLLSEVEGIKVPYVEHHNDHVFNYRGMHLTPLSKAYRMTFGGGLSENIASV